MGSDIETLQTGVTSPNKSCQTLKFYVYLELYYVVFLASVVVEGCVGTLETWTWCMSKLDVSQDFSNTRGFGCKPQCPNCIRLQTLKADLQHPSEAPDSKHYKHDGPSGLNRKHSSQTAQWPKWAQSLLVRHQTSTSMMPKGRSELNRHLSASRHAGSWHLDTHGLDTCVHALPMTVVEHRIALSLRVCVNSGML